MQFPQKPEFTELEGQLQQLKFVDKVSFVVHFVNKSTFYVAHSVLGMTGPVKVHLSPNTIFAKMQT